MNKRKKLPYFKFGLQGDKSEAIRLLKNYPLESRSSQIKEDQIAALNVVLSNYKLGQTLNVRNFSSLTRSERGFSRTTFVNILKHLSRHKLLTRNEESWSKSVITYLPEILKYIPERLIYQPPATILTKDKDGKRMAALINTDEARRLDKRLREWWRFIQGHDIDPGISTEVFEVFRQYDIIKNGRTTMKLPCRSEILPVINYNDPCFTQGGRMYRAFWINMKKVLRRAILIDGQPTVDIDGKSMHVQLLYKSIGEPLPEGELYLYQDERRKITKNLFLLMMNTSHEFPKDIGRKRVISTYKKRFNKYSNVKTSILQDYITQLETFHHKIQHLLYKPNWGTLQNTEAAIMLNIMEAAMKEDIVVLPVHDGCLAKREYKERVLELFSDQRIEAAENENHLKQIPYEDVKCLVELYHKVGKAI